MAEEQTQTPSTFDIRPTAFQATEQYADIAMAGLFNAHVAIINSERQTIWQRYTVMLIANSIFFGFLSSESRTFVEMIFGISFGLSFCSAWLIITVSGWRLFTARRDLAAEFNWTHLPKDANPFHIGIRYESGVPGGLIFRTAIFVIWLFMMAYIARLLLIL